jgi:hypothetical protein
MTDDNKVKIKVWKRAARLVATTFGVVLAAAGITVASGTSEASAAGCYDSAVSVTKKSTSLYAPADSSRFKTTSACKDINLKENASGVPDGFYVRVCFDNGGCQSSYKWVANNSDWRVIASDVKDGTTYRFQFKHYEASVFYVAD